MQDSMVNTPNKTDHETLLSISAYPPELTSTPAGKGDTMATDQIIAAMETMLDKQEIAANYEKYIRARDPFPRRSIHQNLNSLGNSFCSDSNLAGATLCRYNFCTWQVWHETHICCQGMRKICSDDQKMKYDKMKF